MGRARRRGLTIYDGVHHQLGKQATNIGALETNKIVVLI